MEVRSSPISACSVWQRGQVCPNATTQRTTMAVLTTGKRLTREFSWPMGMRSMAVLHPSLPSPPIGGDPRVTGMANSDQRGAHDHRKEHLEVDRLGEVRVEARFDGAAAVVLLPESGQRDELGF